MPFDWRAEKKTSSTGLDVLPVATNTVKRKKKVSTHNPALLRVLNSPFWFNGLLAKARQETP